MASRAALNFQPSANPGFGAPGDRSAELDRVAEYRRRARRLRCQLAGRPAALHGALGDLARQEDSRRGSWKPSLASLRPAQHRHRFEWAHSRPALSPAACYPNEGPAFNSVLGVADEAAERLAQLVRQSLRDGVLSYTSRQDVLKAARRLGVGRFQANLIIAAVQHRYVQETPASEPQQPGRSLGLVGLVAAIIALEVLVLGVAAIAHF